MYGETTCVDRDLCIGSGHCVEVCLNVFEFVEEESELIGVGKCNTCNSQDAIDINPAQAIAYNE